jgi:prevent-host-death family protein
MTVLIDIIISIDATEAMFMKRRLTAVEARKKLGAILDGVYYRGDEVVIERAGKPLAVVVPAHIYENMERRREEFWRLIEETREKNKDVPADVLQAEADEAIAEVRRARQASAQTKTA